MWNFVLSHITDLFCYKWCSMFPCSIAAMDLPGSLQFSCSPAVSYCSPRDSNDSNKSSPASSPTLSHPLRPWNKCLINPSQSTLQLAPAAPRGTPPRPRPFWGRLGTTPQAYYEIGDVGLVAHFKSLAGCRWGRHSHAPHQDTAPAEVRGQGSGLRPRGLLLCWRLQGKEAAW